MSIHREYKSESIWLTDQLERTKNYFPHNSIVWPLFILATIPYILSLIFIMSTSNLYEVDFITIQFLAATTASAGPTLIWLFDQKIFPNFFSRVEVITESKQDLAEIIHKYELFFVDKYWLVVIPWTVLLVGSVVINKEFFSSIGVSSYSNIWFFIYLLFSLFWGYITGIIIHMGITAVLCVHKIGDKLNLDIDPLHPDELGGLGAIGYFSINATLMNSVIGLSLPLGFAIAREGQYRIIVFLAVVIYILLLISLFTYPTIYINRKAQQIREKHLNKRKEEIRKLESEMNNSQGSNLNRLSKQLRLQSLRDDFHEYQAVNLYPFTVSIITKLITSIFLPVLFTLIEAQIINLS